MKYFSTFWASIIVFTAFYFLYTTPTMAEALPIVGVDVVIKHTVNRRVFIVQTDANGNFRSGGNEDGIYDIFISNQSIPSVKTKAKDGYINGRIVILTEDTVAKDPEPIKKSVKKTVTPPVLFLLI